MDWNMYIYIYAMQKLMLTMVHVLQSPLENANNHIELTLTSKLPLR